MSVDPEHGVLLVPHNSLREVQPMLLEERGIVAEIGVAAPDVERAARSQDAGDVPEPGVEQSIERFIGNEVVRQRPVLGPKLSARRLRLLRMSGDIESLMVRRPLE